MRNETLFDEVKKSYAVWNDEAQCFVHFINYDYISGVGSIMMLTGNCCDMSGTIRLFERIDKNVNSIISYYPEGDPDTVYIKVAGKWQARRSGKSRPINIMTEEDQAFEAMVERDLAGIEPQ